MRELRVDEVGYWSEVKLEIVRKYASAYSTIMSRQPDIRCHIYIDGFAGHGVVRSRRTSEYIPGSPRNALNVRPPFTEYHFIDLDGGRAQSLKSLAAGRRDVFVYEADCNEVLLSQVFPRARYEDYRRALCLLDPYGLHLNWKVIYTAGHMRSVEVFLNFPLMDMNMNVLWHDAERVDPGQAARMDAYWGNASWRELAYRKSAGLFDEMKEKASNLQVATAFRKRLEEVAGFKYVPEPMPMKNSKGSVVYYLFFASPNSTGARIVGDIFAKYRQRGG